MKRNIIRQIYLYAVSIISLFLLVFAGGQIVNLGLKTWVFTGADFSYGSCEFGDPNYVGAYPAKPVAAPGETAPVLTDEERAKQKAACEKNRQNQRTAQRQNDLVSALSMLIVAAPVFIFHFRIVQKERKEEKEGREEEKKA